MGGERTREWKYLLLYPACCVALLLGIWGCAHFPEKWKGEVRLARAWTHFSKGKYELSLNETKEVLRIYPRSLGDQALFQMGLLYAHHKNPDQDYQRSLESLQRVIKEFPLSKFKIQAEVWVWFIQEIIDKEKEISALKQDGSRLGKALGDEEEKVKRLEAQVEKLKDQLLKLKEIDLGIEEKKSR